MKRPPERLLLLEHDPWRRESLAAFLRGEGFEVASDEDGGPPSIVLLNLSDEAGGVAARMEPLRKKYPEARILAFVREVNARTAFPCLLAGVKGVLPFDAPQDEIRHAIACVKGGSLWTPRPVLSEWVDRIVRLGVGKGSAFTRSEQLVLEGIRDALSNKEIGRRLGVTEATIKFHVGKLLRKTGSADRRELARFASETVPVLPVEAED